ncbi:MAG: Flagellar basal-body rod protein FlgB [Thermoleophilia bacterium]|nr:Flagellar basal-body rod protein FlgB [Thermoleophilia bacterium]
MFSTDGILGRNFAVSSAALDGLAKRQQLHAENLANVDTKGYRAKTIDFESVLGGVLKDPNPGVRWSNPLATSNALRDAHGGGTLSSMFNTTTRSGKVGVDRTKEVALMANDNIRFRVLTQQVTNQISAVRSVIAEMGRG